MRERELTKSSFSFFSSLTKRQANFQLPMPYGWWSEPSFFSFFVVSTGEKKCWWSCFFMATNSDQRLHFSKWRFPSFSTLPTFTSRYYTPPNVGQIILLDWKKCAFLKFRGVTCLSFPLPIFLRLSVNSIGANLGSWHSGNCLRLTSSSLFLLAPYLSAGWEAGGGRIYVGLFSFRGRSCEWSFVCLQEGGGRVWTKKGEKGRSVSLILSHFLFSGKGEERGKFFISRFLFLPFKRKGEKRKMDLLWHFQKGRKKI